jgi:putative transposase
MALARRFGEGEYYHIMNRGAHRHPTCKDKNDWQRFMFSVLFLQSAHRLKNVSRFVEAYSLLTGYPLSESDLTSIITDREVDVVCFALMPNHFHILVQERQSGGIARYMQRMETAYTMYFNTKYESSGHLFQGRYKAIHVKDNRQLLYLSAYIHRNPREIKGWVGREAEYPWSSLQDYVTANRWGGLLATDIIASQFGATKDSNYADFVRTSTAKTLKKELADLRLS